jgi:signal transduction histidine kinase
MMQAFQLPASTRNQWRRLLMGYAVFAVVAVRTLYNATQFRTANMAPIAALLAVILFLFSTEPALTRRVKWYPYLYTPLYALSALGLGLQHPYFDVWGILFIYPSVQVLRFFKPMLTITWLITYAVIVLGVLTLTLGVAGFTAGLTMVAGSIGFVSFEILYTQAEAAQRNSQKLLADLREAHNKLVAFTGQVEELTTVQERNRLARDLHDTVSQEIFSITLNAQAVSVLLERDPERVPAQLDQLQVLTNGTLVKLRSLITQLHPPQTSQNPSTPPPPSADLGL